MADEIYRTLLRDELDQINQAYGNKLHNPPECFRWMEGNYTAYESRTMLQVEFPVRTEMLNPIGNMQGGFITAAFDNVFGPLSYLAARGPALTLELSTQYLRAVGAGDRLTITCRVISRSPQTMLLSAEATNLRGKVVALATANVIVPPRG